MAVLNRKDFFSQLNDRVGTDTSDEALSFVENMTDTYNDMERRMNDTENWEQKYRELDEAWKKKYRQRFFSSEGRSRLLDDDEDKGDTGYDPSHIKIEDLFTKK